MRTAADDWCYTPIGRTIGPHCGPYELGFYDGVTESTEKRIGWLMGRSGRMKLRPLADERFPRR